MDSPFVIETVGQRDEIKVGVMGLPEQATKELGEKISNEIIENLTSYVNMLEENKEELPIIDGKVELNFRPFEIKTLYVER